VGYSKWVPYLSDPSFNASTIYGGVPGVNPEYTIKDFEESLLINVMAAALVGLAIVFPLLLMQAKFRSKPSTTITATEHF